MRNSVRARRHHEVDLVPSGTLRAASTKAVSSTGNDAEDPDPGRPPHHDQRREPADCDRLLGERARDAVRLRAAEPRQRGGEPLYFDPGDGRLITVFTKSASPTQPTPREPGFVHHLAFSLSPADLRTDGREARRAWIQRSGVKDRGFMDSIYFDDPLGLLVELASIPLRPPAGHTHTDVLLEAHRTPRRARRSEHRPRAPRRRHRAPRGAIAGVALGGSIAKEPVPLIEGEVTWPRTR